MTFKQLKPGDVIRTNPRDGFWGCAVVLSDFPKVEGTVGPQCHIAVTPVVEKHPFALKEISPGELVILDFLEFYTPRRDVTLHNTRRCILLYPNTALPAPLEVIGSIDAGSIYNGPPLKPIAGGGPGEYPAIMPHDPFSSLGFEAVIAWRRIHDLAALQAEEKAADDAYFAREEARLQKAREARRRRKGGT